MKKKLTDIEDSELDFFRTVYPFECGITEAKKKGDKVVYKGISEMLDMKFNNPPEKSKNETN